MHVSIRYKERLNLKFLKTNHHTKQLDSSRWTFIADDIDDFRSGAPVKTKGSGMVTKATVNPVPLINTRSSVVLKKTSSTTPSTSQLKKKPVNDNPGHKTLYTKWELFCV